jgi:16S rRNA (guanine966-N2)-methyltransferase
MTRIIAGSARGRRLRTPHGDRTRPTTDRVREALFSAVESALGSLHGLRFLDLYAGSGAVGLEAASRGAAEVTLVEKDPRTVTLIGDNVRTVGLVGVRVLRGTVARHLDEGRATPYDVAFLDPPYTLPTATVEAHLAVLGRGWLAPDALVVVERSARDQPVAWPEGYEPGRVRSYGETSLSFATWVRYGRGDLPEPEEP